MATARLLAIGDAPITQTSTSTWAGAWARPGASLWHKADATNAAEAWSAVKLTDQFASTLSGGDLYAGDLGVSGQSAATSTVRQEIDGKEALRVELAEAATSVTIGLARFFAGDDGGAYAEAGRVRLYDAKGLLVGETAFRATGSAGQQLLVVDSPLPFTRLELQAGAFDAGGSFRHGAYASLDGGFGREVFADPNGVKHGSDFMVDKMHFTLALPQAEADSYAGLEDTVLAPAASVLANDRDPNQAPLSAELVAGPAHGSLVLGADGRFSYTPQAGFSGTDSFRYRVVNGKDLSDPVTVTLAVAEVNDAPVAGADSASVDEDASVLIDVLANDSAGEAGQLLAVSAASALHGSVTVDAAGRLLYTPQPNYHGADTISYTIVDNGSSGGQADPRSSGGSVAVTVKPVNDAPRALPDAVATSEDAPVSGNVLSGQNGGADSDVDGDVLSVANAGSFLTALGARVTLGANGSFSYDPTVSATLQALGAGATLADGFDYLVTDGHGGTSSAHMTVTVSGLDEPAPPARGVQPSTAPGTEQHYYMRLSDERGNGQWIEVLGFELGVTAASAPVKGGSVGAAVPGEFTLRFDALPVAAEFTAKLLRGEAFSTVELEAYTRGQVPQLLQEFRLGEVYVTGVRTAGSGGAAHTEVTLAYRTLGEAVSPLDDAGKPVAADTVGWDVPGGRLAGGDALPAPGPDTRFDELAVSSRYRGELDYYVHIDGVPGWYPLSAFSLGYGADAVWTSIGASVSAPVPDAVSLTLGTSKAVTAMLESMVLGKPAASVQVEAYGRGPEGQPVLLHEYAFNSAMFFRLDSSSTATNQVSLVYKSHTESHLGYDWDWSPRPGANTAIGYDLAREELVAAPAPVAHAVADTLPPAQIPPGAELFAYLRYTDADGASHWVRVQDFAFSAEAGTNSDRSGPVLGKAVPGPLSVSFGSSSAQADFLAKIWSGRAFSSVELEVYRPSPKGPQLVQELKLGNAFVSGVETRGGAEASGATVSLVYKTIGSSVLPQDKTAMDSFGWDVAQNRPDTTAAVLPNGQADAAVGMVEEAQATDLRYFVKLAGQDGWAPLSGLQFAYSAATSLLGSAKPVADGVRLELGSNAGAATLLRNMLLGTELTLEVEAYEIGPRGLRLVDEYTFTGALATGYASLDGVRTGVDLAYRSISQAHVGYTADGDIDPATSSRISFDIPAQRTGTAAAPNADVLARDMLNLMPSTEADTGLGYYLRYTDAGGRVRWVEVDGYAFSGSATSSSETSAGVGRATAGAFTTTLGQGAWADAFLARLLSGASIGEVALEVVDHGGGGQGPQVVQEIRLGGVWVTGVETVAGREGNSVELEMVYKTFGQSLSPIGGDGKASAPQLLGFDWLANRVDQGSAVLPQPGLDATLDALVPQAPRDAALEYFVRFGGTEGWYALDDFSLGFAADSTISTTTGVTVGKPVVDALRLHLGSGEPLTDLLAAIVTGQGLGEIEIEAYLRTGDGKPRLVEEYIVKNAFATGLDSATQAENALEFIFKSFTHSHIGYTPDGRMDAASSSGTGYDTAKAAVIGAPPPVAYVYG